MNNPQLFDYIHQQLSTGVSKEEISKALIANGWQVADINEVFASITNSQVVISSPIMQMPVQNSVQPTVSSHKGMMAVVIVLLLLVGAGGAFAAYHYGLFTTTPTVAPSTSPVASGMTRYNSGLLGITIDYDATKLFEHSLAGMEDGLYTIEQKPNFPGTRSNPPAGSPDAYQYSVYSLTWSYYQYPDDLQQVLARECTSDTDKKIESQTLTTSDGTALQGCHIVVTGGTLNKPEIGYAQVVYFVEHPITKNLIKFNMVENFIGGGQEADVQKLYTQADGLVRSVSFYTPNQAGLDLLKKIDDMKKGYTTFMTTTTTLPTTATTASPDPSFARGNDAAIQADLSTIQTQAEIYYGATGNGNSYKGVCINPVVIKALNGAKTANGGTAPTCNTSATAYAVSSPLLSGGYWCVDSTGFAGKNTAVLGIKTVCSTATNTTSAPNTTSSPTVTITAGPLTVIAGQPSGLNVYAVNADNCSVPNVDLSRSSSDRTNWGANIFPTQTTTYTATCTGAGGSASKSITVTVSVP